MENINEELNKMLDRSLLIFTEPQEVGYFTRRLFSILKRNLPLVDKDGNLYNPDGTPVTYREGN